jgi:hypothetical protein
LSKWLELQERVEHERAALFVSVRSAVQYDAVLGNYWEGYVETPPRKVKALLHATIEGGPCPDRETLAAMILERWDAVTA